jgi:hypothetical protein
MSLSKELFNQIRDDEINLPKYTEIENVIVKLETYEERNS